MIRNEGGSVEGERAALSGFFANPIACHHGHEVRRRVALHDVLPMRLAVELRLQRLAADCRRIDQQLRTGENHAARRLGEPLIPTDRGADPPVSRVRDQESGVATAEVVVLPIAGELRYVALAVVSGDPSVCVD